MTERLMTSDRSLTRTFWRYAPASLLVVAVLCLGWAGYETLRDRAAKNVTDVSFYGSVNTRWEGRSIVDATTETGRQFPGVLDGPETASEGSEAHTVRLLFRAELDYRLRLHLIQSDSNNLHPPRLELSLDAGKPVWLDVAAGSGRDPLTTERAAPHDYQITFENPSRCGENEIRITAASGTWIAIERVDIQLLPDDGAIRTASAAGLSALLVSIGVLVKRRRQRARTLSMAPSATRVAARMLLVGISLAMALLICEGLLAFLSTRSTPINRLLYSSRQAEALPDTPEILTALMAHHCAEAPCSLFPGGFRLNRYGFQTTNYQYEKPPGVTRVVGIGDSFMFYGGPVPYADSFFARVESDARRSSPEKRLEFINLGFSCIGIPSERALLFQEGLRLNPDLVVWSIYLGNDITDENTGNRDQLKDSSVVSGGPASWLESWRVYRLASHVVDLAARDPKLLFPGCAAERRSTIPVVMSGQCGYLEDPHAGEPYDPQAKTLSDDRYLIYGVDRLRTMYVQSQQERIHRLVDALVGQFDRVRAQIGTARVWPVVIPDQFQVSPAEVDRILDAEPSLRRERFDFGYTASAVADGLAGLGFNVLNVTDLFRETIRAGTDPYQPNDGHLSVVGNRLVAEQVARALHENGIW